MISTEARITVSVVLYENRPKHLEQLLESLTACTLILEVYFVDNSPTDSLRRQIPTGDHVHYYKAPKNLGYGQGHNHVLKATVGNGDYHLVINPDVYFGPGTLERLTSFMDEESKVGLALPRVLNPDGTDQPLFKLLPTPGNLLLRRFLPSPLKSLFKNELDRYRMASFDLTEQFDAPYLSGCFMFLRKEALRDVGLFDPRFFMYCEDIDLSRRVRSSWRTTYYPQATIKHYFYKGSYKELRLLYHHILSAFKYFNKHGWFKDPTRDEINNATLATRPSETKILNLSVANET